MDRTIHSLCVIALVGLIANCASTKPANTKPTYVVSIDAINSDEAIGKKRYILLSGAKDVKESDLQFKEYANYVKSSLVSNGFIHVDNIEEADIGIFLVYGIGDPQERQYIYTVPTWGRTGTSSSTVIGNTVFHTPSYGITGYTAQTDTYTTYFRYLGLEAIDFKVYKQSEKIVQLWKTTVTSLGSSGDLRVVFPIMVAASGSYFGDNTGKKVDMAITEDDERVTKIKGLSTSQAETDK